MSANVANSEIHQDFEKTITLLIIHEVVVTTVQCTYDIRVQAYRFVMATNVEDPTDVVDTRDTTQVINQ